MLILSQFRSICHLSVDILLQIAFLQLKYYFYVQYRAFSRLILARARRKLQSSIWPFTGFYVRQLLLDKRPGTVYVILPGVCLPYEFND